MSLKKVHDDQPKDFKFSDESLKKAEEILKRYPKKNKKSAVMPFLYLAQRQNKNWIPLAAMKYIANFLSMPYISVYEVATFYTMYNLAPVGKHFIQVCTTTPCLLRGADKIVKLCKERISSKENEISKKGNCSISPRRRYFMRNITEARFVRMISGSVNSGLDSKSLCAYKRIQTPSAMRPQRPFL